MGMEVGDSPGKIKSPAGQDEAFEKQRERETYCLGSGRLE